ncbi:hypothetical protein [Streptococcus tangpeifui]|uniref:hypothetical protein n=1 Tax=Streptococcus tangpeifui TaxID=2709400 RepID=UPI0013EA3A7A|nr:hypothetical protein [Streptococcus sp. ZJ373]
MTVKQSSGLFKGMPENGTAPQDKDLQSTLGQTVITAKDGRLEYFSPSLNKPLLAGLPFATRPKQKT